MSNLRYAFRTLIRRPWFSFAVVMTLALGLGANTAIFSFVRGILLRPLPYHEPDRLVVLWTVLPDWGHETASYPDYLDWTSAAGVFDRSAAYVSTNVNLATPSGEPERVGAALVTGDFLGTLGVRPTLGRPFTPDDEIYGAHRVVLLSDALWRRSFGGDSGVVGRTVLVNALPYTVIGVAPPGLGLPEHVALWAPYAIDPDNPPLNRRSDFLHVLARLAPGVSETGAQARMDALALRLGQDYPGTNLGVGIDVVPLQEEMVGRVRAALLVFSGAVALVLLIACANIANLLLARALARDREMAVRAALGAGRADILRMLLVESALMAGMGGGVGLLLAVWGVRGLKAVAPDNLPRLAEVGIDPAVLAFTALVTILTGLLFGLAPALRASAATMTHRLRAGGRGTTAGAERVRRGLVLAQAALSLVLLAGAGLLIMSFRRLQQVDLGFDDGNVITASTYLPQARYEDPGQLEVFFTSLGERVAAAPGVTSVGFSTDIPLQNGYGYNTFAVIGRPAPAPGEPQPDAIPTFADAGYFQTMRIPLLEGRMFGPEDVQGGMKVVLVNREMVGRWFGGRSPLGEQITWGNPDDQTSWRTIVGVVANTRLTGVGEESYPQVYMPLSQAPQRSVFVVARTEGDPLAMVPTLRREVAALDPSQPLANAQSMRGRVETSIAPWRFNSVLVTAFAGFALLLASLGIYGVVAYAVAQRTRELGIRLALGASAGQVIGQVVREGMAPVGLGVAVGLAGGLLISRLIARLLFQVSPADPVVFVGVTATMMIVALAACYLPARRAAGVHPMDALREE